MHFLKVVFFNAFTPDAICTLIAASFNVNSMYRLLSDLGAGCGAIWVADATSRVNQTGNKFWAHDVFSDSSGLKKKFNMAA